MEQIEREMALKSLTNLESYYQSRYEYYLAMATSAKDNRERVQLLLQDLLRNDATSEHYLLESSSINQQHSSQLIEPRNPNNRKTSLELPSTASSLEDSFTQKAVDEDNSVPMGATQMRRFLQNLSKAISVIELVSNSDSGKTLHQNYLHKILNHELEQELSVDLVELYLDEAIAKGLIERDQFDNHCYLAKSRDHQKELASGKQNSDVAQQIVPNPSKNQVKDDSKSRNPKPYNLPHSTKLKPTLLETVTQYIVDCNPQRFSMGDIVNYLYTQKQQLNWSKAKKNQVCSCISNVLGRQAYLNKYWSRIRPGVYQPELESELT
jgi:hypothetical protein